MHAVLYRLCGKEQRSSGFVPVNILPFLYHPALCALQRSRLQRARLPETVMLSLLRMECALPNIPRCGILGRLIVQ